MRSGKPGEGALAIRGQADADLPPVAASAYALHQPAFHQPVGQPHSAVVLNEQIPG